jgi:hypothetical protein
MKVENRQKVDGISISAYQGLFWFATLNHAFLTIIVYKNCQKLLVKVVDNPRYIG